MEQLRKLYLPQLKKIAVEFKIKRLYGMNKAELIKEIGKFTDEEINEIKQKVAINDNYVCVHGRCKYFCKECKGSQICIHNKIKYQCKECGGSQICEHGKQKSRCKECRGSQICEHGKQKQQCKECGGSQICEHNKQKASCKECRIKLKMNYDLKL